MNPLVYLLFSMHTLMLQQIPAGTPIEVRLENSVGSFASKAGDPISAIVIAPVIIHDLEVLPPGSIFSGKVKSVTRVGYGVRHETASLRLEFNKLTLPDGAMLPAATRLVQVENGRENVTSSGLIQGVRSTGSISNRVAGYVKTALLWDVHAEMAEWAIKSMVVSLPEPEIYYPAGTELNINLTKQMTLVSPAEADPVDALTDEQIEELRGLVAGMPIRTSDPYNHRPSDPTNVLLIGSREEISQAFRAAGWSEARPDSIRSRIGTIRAAAEIHGFRQAPMTSLLLKGAEADMSWQKGLNDVAKRHHIRIWKQAGTWNGQELWMAAATRDVDFAYLRPGQYFAHEIDAKVDEEREKVAYDLEFTSCASPLMWVARQGMPRFTRNGTGDPMGTDTRMVVMQFNSCATPRLADESEDTRPLTARGSKWQRFLRREVLVTRSDLLRSNIYYRSFEVSRWAYRYMRYRQRKAEEMRSLLATYGPAGSSAPAPPHNSTLTVKALR
jgi:hypothetical protein